MTKWLAIAASGVMALCFTGCQNSVNTYENTPSHAADTTVDTSKFTTDSFCSNRLSVLSARVADTPEGLARLQLRVRSERYGFWADIWSWFADTDPYRISYKVEWFDGQGMAVGTAANTVWIPELFYPGEVKSIQSTAPNSRCRDFHVSFMETK